MSSSGDQDRLQRAGASPRDGARSLPAASRPAPDFLPAGDDLPGKAASHADTECYRPLRRPPMAVLQVFDDGLKSSESIRVRTTPFIIGREKGDLVLPHDRLISGSHAAIECTPSAGRAKWTLRDLGSANGTFVRVKQSLLEADREFTVARRRLRFVAPVVHDAAADLSESQSDVRRTLSWSSLVRRKQPEGVPSLVEALPQGEGRRFPLLKSEQWIGRTRDCAVYLDDPTVSPRHARVFKARDGKWCVEDANSLNGLWVRITSLPLSTGAFFLLGEQIFLITFP